MKRFEVVTIFPEFFSVLDLSLLGKAADAGSLEFAVHDLRQWASGRHRSVDDAPYGGGAGMVMRADVWGRALDDVLARVGRPVVLAVPTPAGAPLTQRMVAQLAARDDAMVIACGRYEGIDRRVMDHYRAREGVEVVEYSLGDYVLNGGEVAALALIEAVGRLGAGVVGNPQSLVEESHGSAGLLEYPVYTRPASWRGLDVPDVLVRGDHAKVERWRRDWALALTAKRRPDLLAGVLPSCDRADLEALARAGYLVDEGSVRQLSIREASPEEAPAVSELAGALFPDACPAGLGADHIARFIDTELSAQAFSEAIDTGIVCHAAIDGELIGYAYMVAPPAPYVGETLSLGGAQATTVAYLSKLYVQGRWRGAGVAAALLEAVIVLACERWSGLTHVLLGTNAGNARALRFYRRHGFRKVGRRTFDVGGVSNDDYVLVRDLTHTPQGSDLTMAPPAWNNDPGAEPPRDLPQGERRGGSRDRKHAGR